MVLKLLQLNIFQGKFLDRVIDFVKQNNVDILHFQEVTAGKMSKGGRYRYPKDEAKNNLPGNDKFAGVDCFEEVKSLLNMDGLLVKVTGLKDDPDSYIGNATFFNQKIKLLESETVWLKDYMEIDEDFRDLPALSRAALIAKFSLDTKQFTAVNTHFTWGPNALDEPYKIDQAKILYEKISEIRAPLVLTGDFNVTPETETASMFDNIGRNLVKENKIINTLNPRTHPAKILFPPGIAVDYIFTSDELEIKNFTVIEGIDLSDHYGLLCEFAV